ncbi:MAG: DUF805 domain-containing protein [Pseudomonadota bacterium]
MGPVDAIISGFVRVLDFTGRSTRSEFWWFVLFLVVLQLVISNAVAVNDNSTQFVIGLHMGVGAKYPWWLNIFTAVFFLPFLSLLVRRCHDVGFPGSYIIVFGFALTIIAGFSEKAQPPQSLMNIIIIGVILLFLGGFFIVSLSKSEQGSNAFGPNPNEVPS